MDRYNSEGYPDPTAAAALSNVAHGEKQKNPYIPLIYIASPFAGDTERNVERARGYCRFAVSKGVMPLAPHLHYPQFLDDDDREQRELGLRFALILLGKCDELWVFGDSVSGGMSREIAKAKKRGMPIGISATNARRYHAMATKKTEPVTALTDFDIWKQTLTPEFIAEGKFIVLSCGACPASGKTCNKYDTTCRGNFLNWARNIYKTEEVAEDE